MGYEALGPVYPSAPIAAKLVRDIKERMDDIYFETFEDYFLRLNIVRMKRPAKDKKWISAIRDAIQTEPPSTDESAVSSTAAGSSGDSNYMAKPKVEVSKFRGNFHTFITWQTNFENILSGARVPESEWVWLMNQNMETGTTAQRMMNDYVESGASYDDIVTAFSRYFDKLKKRGVLKQWNKIYQLRGEDLTTFYHRFKPHAALMVRFGCIPAEDTSPTEYANQVNEQFMAKIHDELAVEVQRELRRKGKTEVEMKLHELYQLALDVEEESLRSADKPGIHMLQDTEKGINETYGFTVRKCYYCGSDKHMIKNCEDKRLGREPQKGTKK